jgi:WD40 repeat protein
VVAFSPDGRTLVSASGAIFFTEVSMTGITAHLEAGDRTIKLWEISTGRKIFSTTVEQSDGLTKIALSSDGKYLVSGHRDGSIKLWEVVG